MTDPLLEKLVRFQRPELVLPFAQNLSTQDVAGIFGTDEAGYRSTLESLATLRTAVAARLAADPVVGSRLSHVPFKAGDHLVAIGESTTADRLSWFELLRTVLETHRPDLSLRFTNLAVSGATSTQTLAALPSIRRQAADWTFCMLGGNDAQRLGASDDTLLVSRPETLRNLAQLRARAGTDGRWIWLTPTPVDESRIAAYPFFRSSGISWTNADLKELATALSHMADPVIDSSAAVTHVGPHAFAEDGLHPSLATHEALAAQVLEALTDGNRR